MRNDLLEVTENDILNEVSAKGSDATVVSIIRAVSAKRPPSVVREAYWRLISNNRLTRAANGHLARTVTSIVAIILIVMFAAPAQAAPADPHIPDPGSGYCPGGGAGSMIWLGYCDGVPYPDGSYWHHVQYGLPVIGHPGGLLSPGTQCVVNVGGPTPAPAPAGGCGGAV